MEEEYDLELKKAAEKIKEKNAKIVLIQLPDGLKPKAKQIQEELQKLTGAEIVFWAGSNFGSCDIPTEAERLGIDLIIHYGHSQWR